MARKRRSSKNKKSQLPMALGGGAAVLALAVGAAVVMKPSERREDSPDSRFSIVDYRHDASRLTGNSYRLVARVENIQPLGILPVAALHIKGKSITAGQVHPARDPAAHQQRQAFLLIVGQ